MDAEVQDAMRDALCFFRAMIDRDDLAMKVIVDAQGGDCTRLVIALSAWFAREMAMGGFDPAATAEASLARLQEV